MDVSSVSWKPLPEPALLYGIKSVAVKARSYRFLSA